MYLVKFNLGYIVFEYNILGDCYWKFLKVNKWYFFCVSLGNYLCIGISIRDDRFGGKWNKNNGIIGGFWCILKVKLRLFKGNCRDF